MKALNVDHITKEYTKVIEGKKKTIINKVD